MIRMGVSVFEGTRFVVVLQEKPKTDAQMVD